MHLSRIIISVSFLGFLAGCVFPGINSAPTPYPPDYLPTVVALTGEAIGVASTQTSLASVPTGTATEVPFPTDSPTPTNTPTQVPTSTPTPIPGHSRAAIEILAPGPMSKVTSPLQLRLDVIAGESDLVEIALYGEDGRLLARKLERIPRRLDGVYLSLKIPFEIRLVSELGRITISTLDKAGRMQALSSVHVLLLSSGSSEINQPGNLSERIALFHPAVDETVSGGVLNIKGDIWPFNLQPVVLELLGPKGEPLGLRILTLPTNDPQMFTTTVPFKITEPTLARLTIRQDDERIKGTFYIFSQEVLLNP